MARLLFVDDEESIRSLYAAEFEGSGHDLHFADSGEAALRMSREVRPDLIVMDIRMPKMDGLEALGRVVAEDNDVPVIIYSAYPHHKEDFSSWLADAYLIKSFDMTELKQTIARKLAERGKS